MSYSKLIEEVKRIEAGLPCPHESQLHYTRQYPCISPYNNVPIVKLLLILLSATICNLAIFLTVYIMQLHGVEVIHYATQMTGITPWEFSMSGIYIHATFSVLCIIENRTLIDFISSSYVLGWYIGILPKGYDLGLGIRNSGPHARFHKWFPVWPQAND